MACMGQSEMAAEAMRTATKVCSAGRGWVAGAGCLRETAAGVAGFNEGFEVVRMHQVPRTELFTPLKVPGAPRAAQLTPARITRGRFVDSGEEFQLVDCWTRRDGGAHKHLGRKWVGTTTFWKKSSESALMFQMSDYV